MSEESVVIEKYSFVRIRTQDVKGHVTITSLQRVVDLTSERGYVIFDVEPVTLSNIQVPHGV